MNLGADIGADIGDYELITDASFEALARSCPLLESVNLCGCELITDASVAALKVEYSGVSVSMMIALSPRRPRESLLIPFKE